VYLFLVQHRYNWCFERPRWWAKWNWNVWVKYTLQNRAAWSRGDRKSSL